MQSNLAPVSEAAREHLANVLWSDGMTVAANAILHRYESKHRHVEIGQALQAIEAALANATPAPRPIGEDGAADGGVRAEAVADFVRAWRGCTRWDRAAANNLAAELTPMLARLAATPPIPEQAPAAHRTEREAESIRAAIEEMTFVDWVGDEAFVAGIDEAADAILALQAIPPDHVAQSEEAKSAPADNRMREAVARLLSAVHKREDTLAKWEQAYPGTVRGVVYIEADADDVKIICAALTPAAASGEEGR